MGTSGNQLSDDEATGSQREPALILSPREKQLLRRLAKGKSDKQIAKEIGGTERQVATQRQTLRKKLQVQSEAQLAEAADRFASWPSKSMKAVRTAAEARRHLSGPLLHDLKSLFLQFQQYALRQVQALFGLDPMRTSPIRVVFLRVTGECCANGGFDNISWIVRHLHLSRIRPIR